jgi:orotidine-5'-phosphate decarboxylase
MKKAQDYIVFPLDTASIEDAHHYIQLLSPVIGMFKVGLELFIEAGPDIIKYIRDHSQAKIFLDLKLHDIPMTVKRATERIAELHVDFTTVHCAENPEMLEAAIMGSRNQVDILGVTVLTSVSGTMLEQAGLQTQYAEDVTALVIKRAEMAKTAGCRGIVCSGREVKMIREHFGQELVLITPGIRPQWEAVNQDDQQRIVTPAQAIQNGSDYIVIGRPIRDSNDPKEAALRIAEEIQLAL